MEHQERYDIYKEQHPDWSDEQIWTAISLDMETKKAVLEGGKDVDVHSREFVDKIIRKAMDWLDQVMPIVYEKVQRFLTKALECIGYWISKGWDYLVETWTTYDY